MCMWCVCVCAFVCVRACVHLCMCVYALSLILAVGEGTLYELVYVVENSVELTSQ